MTRINSCSYATKKGEKPESFYFTRIYAFMHMGFQLEKLKETDCREDLSIARRISHWVLKK